MKYKALKACVIDRTTINAGDIIEVNPEFQLDDLTLGRLERYEPGENEKFIVPRGNPTAIVYTPYTASATGEFRGVTLEKNDRVFAPCGETTPRYLEKIRKEAS